MKRSHNRSIGGLRSKGLAWEGSSEQPLVSVITAVFNGELHLAECIESVLCQSYAHVEHLVIDGASNDGTMDVLQSYDDRLAMWISEPDLGVYDAWNKALGYARGEWICFVGADDELMPESISRYMELAAENPDAEFLSSRVDIVHSSGYSKVRGGPWTWREFSRWMCTPHVGSMHRRSLFQRLGNYDTSYRITADYEFLLRERDRLRAAYMPVITAKMRDGGMSCTRRALEEQAIAKIASGGRNKALTSLELHYANAKYALRPLRYACGKIRQLYTCRIIGKGG